MPPTDDRDRAPCRDAGRGGVGLGGPDRSRTCDICLAKAALCQLSYGPVSAQGYRSRRSPSIAPCGLRSRGADQRGSMASVYSHSESVGLIWSIADLLRGDLQGARLRRRDPAVGGAAPAGPGARRHQAGRARPRRGPGCQGHREPRAGAASHLEAQLLQHLAADLRPAASTTRTTSPRTCVPTSTAFSPNARDVIEKFGFDTQVDKLNGAGLLYPVLARFVDVDLHPDQVSNPRDGLRLRGADPQVFRDFSNETAGEHFTPREVVRSHRGPAPRQRPRGGLTKARHDPPLSTTPPRLRPAACCPYTEEEMRKLNRRRIGGSSSSARAQSVETLRDL